MILGTIRPGRFVPIPPRLYLGADAMSKRGQAYEIRVKTTPMSLADEAKVAKNVMGVKVTGLQVLGVEAKGDTVRFQVNHEQFAWVALFSALPALIGPIIALIVGLLFFTAIPSWIWGALVLTLGASVFAYAVVKARK